MKKKLVNKICQYGLTEADAEKIADVLITSDTYGVTSHGTCTLNAHLDKIKQGGYNLSPHYAVIKETGAFAVIDGDNSIGFLSADYCMKYAAERAKEVGIFHVWCRNNNTCGPAFYYPLQVAEEGLIGIIFTNSPAQMAPTNGKEKILGTNPFAAVIPVPDNDPIIIDMATSIVAKSKFKEYSEKGQMLPDGWAIDNQGNPTNNPIEGIKGLVQPMGGYKGYAISMLIDIIAGLLSGSFYLNKVGRFYSNSSNGMNVGFCCIVIDPKIILGNEYKEKIQEFVQIIRSSEKAGVSAIELPGDRRIKCKNENLSKISEKEQRK